MPIPHKSPDDGSECACCKVTRTQGPRQNWSFWCTAPTNPRVVAPMPGITASQIRTESCGQMNIVAWNSRLPSPVSWWSVSYFLLRSEHIECCFGNLSLLSVLFAARQCLFKLFIITEKWFSFALTTFIVVYRVWDNFSAGVLILMQGVELHFVGRIWGSVARSHAIDTVWRRPPR